MQLLQQEIANHNITRQELALKDEQLGRSIYTLFSNSNIGSAKYKKYNVFARSIISDELLTV